MTTPTAPTYRATHRVETPGRPPLYCLREEDALAACGERGTPSVVYLLTRTTTGTGTESVESWDFWRTAP